MTEEVEILVVGGGPAGLLAASYLAERHNVALIERGVLGQTTKYWLTSRRRLEKNDLSECVYYQPAAMTIGTFLGGYLETGGDLVIVDDQLFLSRLIERCRSREVHFTDQCSLLSLNWTRDRILAKTTSKSYATRLVVDASGANSPIAKTFRLHRLYGFFSVYGALLRNITLSSDKIVLAHAERLGDPPPIIEVYPIGEDAAFCSVFIYSKQLMPPETLKTLFEDYCEHNAFFAVSDRTVQVSPKLGAIPIGRIRKQNLAGLVSIGEAGLVQPPLLGSAFNEVLEYSQDLCKHITQLLRTTTGVPNRPGYSYPLLKHIQDRLQLSFVCALLNSNVEVFDHFVRSVGKLPSQTIYNLCFNELTWGQIPQMVMRMPLRLRW